jgi:hydroxyacylglutathione hydrolase
MDTCTRFGHNRHRWIAMLRSCATRDCRCLERGVAFLCVRLESMLHVVPGLLTLAMLFASSCARAQLTPGSMDVRWDEGASKCATSSQPPLQVHPYNDRTFILRENLCATFEAPFMYLLVGSEKALLIDTGDVGDPSKMPLANTVMGLLPGERSAKMRLLVVHTHRHGDHRAGDEQFTRFTNAHVIGFDSESVHRFYHFTDWPKGVAQIDLGDRTVDVLPTPGHNQTEVSFYDRNTGLFFAGDFLMPGRLLIDNTSANLASAQRVAAFIRDRPVSFVLGGHIEMDAKGNLFPWESQFHPHEHVLQMNKDDLLALPAAVRSFNGFYSKSGNFIMMNSIHLLIVEAALVLVAVVALVWVLIRYIRRRKRANKMRAEIQA